MTRRHVPRWHDPASRAADAGPGSMAGPGRPARIVGGVAPPSQRDDVPARVPTLAPHVEAAHLAAVRAGEPGYLDPDTGLFVLTAISLAARGRCCGEGCRHCPYPI